MSPKMTLSAADWKAGAKAALVWSAPMILIYITSVLGVIQVDHHVFSLKDLIPTTFTWGSIVGWAFMQIQGMLLRLTRGT